MPLVESCPPSEPRGFAHRRLGSDSMRQTSLCVRACNDVFMPPEQQQQQQQQQLDDGHGMATRCDAADADAAAAAVATAAACGGHGRCGGGGGGGGDEAALVAGPATLLAPELLIGPATAPLEDTRVDADAETDDASGHDSGDDADAFSATPPEGALSGLQQHHCHPKHCRHPYHHQVQPGRRAARPTTACADGRSSSERLRWVAAHSDVIEPGLLGGTSPHSKRYAPALQGAASVPSPTKGIDLVAMVDAAGGARLSDEEAAAAARPLNDPHCTGTGHRDAPPRLHVSGSMSSSRTPESSGTGQAARLGGSQGRAVRRSSLAASIRGVSSSLMSWLTSENKHGGPGGSSHQDEGLRMADGEQLDAEARLQHLPASLSMKEVQMHRASLQMRWDCEGRGAAAAAAAQLCSSPHAACVSTASAAASGLVQPFSVSHASMTPVLCVQPQGLPAAASAPLPAGLGQGTPAPGHERGARSLSIAEASIAGTSAEDMAHQRSGVSRGLRSEASSPDPPEPQFLSFLRLQSGAGSAGSRVATPRTPTHSLLQDAECRGGSFSPLPPYMQSLGTPGRRSGASSRQNSQISRNPSFVSNSHVALTRLSDEDMWKEQAAVGLPGATA